jgi:hypothetical protein
MEERIIKAKKRLQKYINGLMVVYQLSPAEMKTILNQIDEELAFYTIHFLEEK